MNKWLDRARERLAMVKGQGQRVVGQTRKKTAPSDVVGKEIIVDGFTPPKQESKSLFDLEYSEKKERRNKEKKYGWMTRGRGGECDILGFELQESGVARLDVLRIC